MHPQSTVCLALLLCTVRVWGYPVENPDSAVPNNFVWNGYVNLAHAAAHGHVWRDTAMNPLPTETECEVYCNGELLTDASECIGITTINCLNVEKTIAEDESLRVDVYTRTCEGKFVNKTMQSGDRLDSSQACSGISQLTMKTESRHEGTDQWIADFSYRKTCSTRFIMTVINIRDPTGEQPDITQVATICTGATTTVIDEAPEKSLKNQKVQAGASCNGVESDWQTSCKGIFEAIEMDGDVECQTTCNGEWTPYLVNWECAGEYNFTRYEDMEVGTNARERWCIGASVISASDYDVGYQVCNGESMFNEEYTTPITIF